MFFTHDLFHDNGTYTSYVRTYVNVRPSYAKMSGRFPSSSLVSNQPFFVGTNDRKKKEKWNAMISFH